MNTEPCAVGPRFSAPGRCSLSCPSAARPWLAVQRRRRRAATVQIPQYSARHASSCSSHPHSGRERGPAGRQIAGAADERCSLDCCACVQISAPARRRLFRPAVSRPALAALTQLSGLVEKPRSLQGPAERACRRRADHDSAPRKEPDGPSSVVASLLLTGAANCSFAEPAPAKVNEALAEPINATSPGHFRSVPELWSAAIEARARFSGDIAMTCLIASVSVPEPTGRPWSRHWGPVFR